MEYASAMTEETGIRIVESREALTASVNVDSKTITIPAIDYSMPMTRERYRITKGYIDHEIAHMLHPDPSYLNTTGGMMALNIANLIDDIRIETIHAKNYRGVGEDFHYLNQFFYEQKHLFNRDNLSERSFPAILGTMAVNYFGIQHDEPFNREVYDFLTDKIFPLVDGHIRNSAPNALHTAGEISALVRGFLDQNEQTALKQPDGTQTLDAGIHTGSSQHDGGVENTAASGPENGTQDERETVPSAGDNSEATDFDNAPPPDENGNSIQDEDNELSGQETKSGVIPTGCDISSLLAKEIENTGSDFVPPGSHIIREYHDTVTDLSDPRCKIYRASSGLYEQVCQEYAPVISAYRNMFGSFLVSTARSRMIKTFSGKFNHREAAHAAVSVNPRIFTRKEEGRQFGYDVSLLMDCSGSMGDFPVEKEIHTKMSEAYETLVVLAEAFRGLPDINLEILAFTADIRFTPGMPSSATDSCNNQLFILKSFANRSVGALPYFPLYHQNYNLSADNFDIGAIKLSSRRLRLMPSCNRKLLIVLSDGQPSSDISRGTKILKSYVEELSHIHPIMGIGLENPYISECYPNSVNIDNLSELSGRVFADIRQFLISQINQ
jgi:hypothetical protein